MPRSATAKWVLAFVAIAGFLFSSAARAQEAKNLALNKPASASSEENDQYAADRANDGDGDTRWCADGGTTPQWWQVDLERLGNLTSVQIKWEHDGKRYQYVIEGSVEGETWRTLSDQSNTNSTSQVQNIKLGARGIRYVRIRITGLEEGAWASIYEVKVFGA